jgi:hypothetical protein
MNATGIARYLTKRAEQEPGAERASDPQAS